MKFIKNILFLSTLLAVNAAHFIKRDITQKKGMIFKNEIPGNYERIVKDAMNKNRIPRLKMTEIEINDVDENIINLNNKGKYLKTVDPFILNVHCYSAEDCNDYPTRIQEGAHYVAQAFDFYQSVNVNVTIFPFCKFMTEPGCESIMGITYPPTFVPLSESKGSEAFLYPQALVKQLETDTKINYDETDFIVYLNSSYRPSESQDNRALIAAHEILHGMGFFHQINPISVYINNYQNYFENDFALPPIKYEEGAQTIKYDGWTPFSIFDKYIVGTQNPEDYLYLKLEKYKKHTVNFEISTQRISSKQLNDFMNTFKALENDQEANVGGVEVANLFSSLNAVGFRTKEGKVVELQTFDGSYESASSISHINVPFDCKNSGNCNVGKASINENYLMYFTVINKASTSRLIKTFKEYSKYELIGEDIVKIMCTLGWTEKNTNNENGDNVFSFSQESYGSSGAKHLTTPSCITIILSFVFLCISQLI